jgi:integrase
LTADEVKLVLQGVSGPSWLMMSLLYGAGLRLLECLRLRIKDVDFAYQQITVRDGKGSKCSGQGKTDTQLSHLRQRLIIIGAHVPEI